MKRVLALALAGFLAAGFAAAAPAGAQEYDRYERGTAAPPPPPPPAAPKAKYPPGPPPPPRPSGFHGGTYFFGNIGLFEPNDYYVDYYGTYGLEGYSSGLSLNGGLGYRMNPFFAVEGTVGYLAAERGSDEAYAIPVTIGGRLILPHPMFEPYFGFGVGAYFATLKEAPVRYSSTLYYPGTDDSDTTIGGYVSMGLDMWVTPKFALNVEGRYQMLEPTFTDKGNPPFSFDLDMSGWELNLGFRVNF
jgi:opacity protein-like surface antigen